MLSAEGPESAQVTVVAHILGTLLDRESDHRSASMNVSSEIRPEVQVRPGAFRDLRAPPRPSRSNTSVESRNPAVT